MKVLAILGSPRKRGNTEVLAREVLRGAEASGADVDAVYLDDLTIRPIADVGDVRSSQRVDPRSDDDFLDLLERFLDADVILLASPVYWHAVSGQMKCFLDRMSCYFRVPSYAGHFDGKGYVVVCTFGQDDPNHHRWVTEPLKECVRVLRGRYLGDVSASVQTSKRGEVALDAKSMGRAFQLGKNAVTMAAGE